LENDFTLENERVVLRPLTMYNYSELISIAAQEKLVQYSPSDIYTPEALKKYVETALLQKKNGSSIPFIIYDKKTMSYAGSTRYMHINEQHKVLHIGATWIGREFHGSGLNGQMKKVMLQHAFGVMGFEKVSRKAVEKLGGILEGVLRKNVFLLDGFKRNTCCYGILKEEWAVL